MRYLLAILALVTLYSVAQTLNGTATFPAPYTSHTQCPKSPNATQLPIGQCYTLEGIYGTTDGGTTWSPNSAIPGPKGQQGDPGSSLPAISQCDYSFVSVGGKTKLQLSNCQ
jgi:hypothetical protein